MKITKLQLAKKFNTEVKIIDQCINLVKMEFSKNTCDKCGNSSMVFQLDTVGGFHFYPETLAHSTPLTIHSCKEVGHLIRDGQCIRNIPAEFNSVKNYLMIPHLFDNTCGIIFYNTPNIRTISLLYSLGIKYYIILNKKDEDSKLYIIMNSTDKACIDDSKLVTEIYYIG